ncbi:hypothetical protein DIPPA_14860 [Diplonema papillatum]|nr:hypothetical protein DIPPA_14860 [Diplonema papillatum]
MVDDAPSPHGSFPVNSVAVCPCRPKAGFEPKVASFFQAAVPGLNAWTPASRSAAFAVACPRPVPLQYRRTREV